MAGDVYWHTEILKRVGKKWITINKGRLKEENLKIKDTDKQLQKVAEDDKGDTRKHL